MRSTLSAAAAILLLGAAWHGARGSREAAETERWMPVTHGVFRSLGSPGDYLVIHEGRAIQVGASRDGGPATPRPPGVRAIEAVLLTHAHRDGCASAADWSTAGVPVRASKAAATTLSPAGAARFWNASLPEFRPEKPPELRDRSFGVWEDLVTPNGLEKVDCSLTPGDKIALGPWSIEVIAAPGPSREHVAYVARRTDQPDAPPVLFCGDLMSAPGKLWSPYTTDWHHCFNDGLDAAVASIRSLEKLGAGVVCPEHGVPIVGVDAVRAAWRATAVAAEEAGRLKSYEWYTKEKLGAPPPVKFLAPDQVATAGEKPWTRLSPHLYLTGNTYALVSDDGPILVVDPFGDKIAEQIQRLQTDRNVGPVETVVISHAHNDHYTGAFRLPDRDRWQTWTLDTIARPISEPYHRRAPFLDPRSLKVDRMLRDGDVVRWREYEFRIWRFPGQTEFTMGFETTIDGKRCFHTADNFFHADQFTGSGGWSGRNRSWPGFYAESADRVLAARPDWILAEHGGPFEFHAEDFRRRVEWAKSAGRAADALSPSGNHRFDWDPHRIAIEPLRVRPNAAREVAAEIVATNPLDTPDEITIHIDSVHATMTPVTMRLPPRATTRQPIRWTMNGTAPSGRVIAPFAVRRPLSDSRGVAEDPVDMIAIVDVP